MSDLRRRLNERINRVLEQIEANNFPEAARLMADVDGLSDEFNQRIDGIRADMLPQVDASAATVIGDQQQAIVDLGHRDCDCLRSWDWCSRCWSAAGITRPVRRLLEGTRAVEAGQLDEIDHRHHAATRSAS